MITSRAKMAAQGQGYCADVRQPNAVMTLLAKMGSTRPRLLCAETRVKSTDKVTILATLGSTGPRLLCRSQTAQCCDDPSGTDEQHKAKATVQKPGSANQMMR